MPEVVTASAYAQLVAAKQTIIAMQQMGFDWSLTQAFYFDMGGVWLKPRESEAFPINAAQPRFLIQHAIVQYPSITSEELKDRSKADSFATLSAVVQIIWLAVQSIGRAAQHLPITPLEIATLSLAMPSVATYIFWAQKPVDIGLPTMLHCELTTEDLLIRLAPQSSNWRNTPLNFVEKLNAPSVTSELIVKSPWWPGRRHFMHPASRVRDDVFTLNYAKLEQTVVLIAWAGYAGTHFAPWKFSFPSRTELLWWPISCIVMASSMFVFWLFTNRRLHWLLSYILPEAKEEQKKRKGPSGEERVSRIQVMVGCFAMLLYLVARLSLVALGFSSLRSLPEKAYKTVEWLSFLPHVS